MAPGFYKQCHLSLIRPIRKSRICSSGPMGNYCFGVIEMMCPRAADDVVLERSICSLFCFGDNHSMGNPVIVLCDVRSCIALLQITYFYGF